MALLDLALSYSEENTLDGLADTTLVESDLFGSCDGVNGGYGPFTVSSDEKFC